MDYEKLQTEARALMAGVPYEMANLANLSALLYHTLPQINWAGFYILTQGQLILGPFQGKPACIRIPMGRGVCGTAAQSGVIQRVPDVHAFPGHIACDGASRSEIVIPIRKNGEIWGVLDIDSPVLDRFSQEDQAGLAELVRVLEDILFTY